MKNTGGVMYPLHIGHVIKDVLNALVHEPLLLQQAIGLGVHLYRSVTTQAANMIIHNLLAD